jgi:hypothetical protein
MRAAAAAFELLTGCLSYPAVVLPVMLGLTSGGWPLTLLLWMCLGVASSVRQTAKCQQNVTPLGHITSRYRVLMSLTATSSMLVRV